MEIGSIFRRQKTFLEKTIHIKNLYILIFLFLGNKVKKLNTLLFFILQYV